MLVYKHAFWHASKMGDGSRSSASDTDYDIVLPQARSPSVWAGGHINAIYDIENGIHSAANILTLEEQFSAVRNELRPTARARCAQKNGSLEGDYRRLAWDGGSQQVTVIVPAVFSRCEQLGSQSISMLVKTG